MLKDCPKSAIASLLFSLLSVSTVSAQLLPDGTLDPESSLIVPQGSRDLIEGGAIRDRALFHSFLEFNVGNAQQVYFVNPANIENIFTRVTGNNPSNILGTLGVLGNANLFLLNPNGILFGQNARLDIPGSFVATTADSIQLDGYEFSAINPDAPPLLSLNIVPGLQYGSNQSDRTIGNEGNLSVGVGQTLALYGGTVNNSGNLSAPGGTIEILGDRVELFGTATLDVSGVAGGGTILMGNWELGMGSGELGIGEWGIGEVRIGSDVTLSADAISTPLSPLLPTVFYPPGPPYQGGNHRGGGTVIIKSGTTHFDGHINARGANSSNPSNGGFVEVSGGNLHFNGTVDTSAINGATGTLLLDPKNILVESGGTVSGFSLGFALFSNNVTLQANNDITINDNIFGIGSNSLTLLAGRSLTFADNRNILLAGGDFIAKINDENAFALERDPGIAQFTMNPGSRIVTNGGDILVTSGTFEPISQIDTTNGVLLSSNPIGDSGNITLLARGDITTGLLTSGSLIGRGGDIEVESTNGAIATTRSFVADSPFNAGNISLSAPGNIEVNENLTARALLGAGGNISLTAGGDLSLTASNFDPILGNVVSAGAPGGKLTLTSGGTLSARNLTVYTATFGSDSGSGVVVNARSLQLENASIGAQTRGSGRSGNTIVNATDEVIVRNGSISTDSENGSGDAGDLTLNTRRLRIIKEIGTTYPFDIGIGTDADNSSTGNGGNVTINASESIEIIGDRPGPIILTLRSFIENLLEVSRTKGITGSTTVAGISTAALGGGNSGSATINTGRLLLRDGAAIVTLPDNPNGDAGFGGDLTVNATEILARGQAGFGTGTFGQKAGDIFVSADRMTLTDGAGVGTATNSEVGDAGNLFISVRDLRVLNGSAIATTTNSGGNGGNATIVGAERVEVAGTSIDGSFASAIRSDSLGTGDAGAIAIASQNLFVGNGGEIASNTVNEGAGGDIRLETRILQGDNGSINASTATAQRGGDIRIHAMDVEIKGGSSTIPRGILTNALSTGDAGFVEIVTGRLSLSQGGEISTATLGSGRGGPINLDTRSLQLDSRINASTAGSGAGGAIQIRATESVEVSGTGFETLEQQFINPAFARTLSLDNFEQGIVTVSAGEGTAGTVSIDTANFTARNGGSIATTALAGGRGGDIAIRATEAIALDGALLGTGTFQSADSGNIALTARNLRATGGAQAFTTTFGSGRAGDLTANISESVELVGPVENGFASGLFASSAQTASGEGGNIAIATGQLGLREGAAISVSAEGTGNAGDIGAEGRSLVLENSAIAATSNGTAGGNINLSFSDSVQLRDRSRLSTATRDGVAGRLRLRAGNGVVVEESEIASSATGNGTAGSVELEAGQLTLRSNSMLAVSSAGRGDGGNLRLRAGQIALKGSSISAETNAGGNGNIAIAADNSLTLVEGSRISAATVEGRGGTVELQVGGPLP
ncbi:MAG: filamentous hemagglutinin N-terminal domain-containing protein [Cyanobacteriota bacterium]|nr:filamentous hemagglutinin N-terminal domain-containing protein [Cyanobacteriota bacterium]